MIIVGWILFVAGALITSVMIAGIIAKPDDLAAAIAITMLFGNVPLVVGAILVRAGRAKRRRRRIDAVERQLLAIAQKNNGDLTATLVAMETPLSIDEAREILEMFVTRGVVDMRVDDNGSVIYHFRELTVGRN